MGVSDLIPVTIKGGLPILVRMHYSTDYDGSVECEISEMFWQTKKGGIGKEIKSEKIWLAAKDELDEIDMQIGDYYAAQER